MISTSAVFLLVTVALNAASTMGAPVPNRMDTRDVMPSVAQVYGRNAAPVAPVKARRGVDALPVDGSVARRYPRRVYHDYYERATGKTVQQVSKKRTLKEAPAKAVSKRSSAGGKLDKPLKRNVKARSKSKNLQARKTNKARRSVKTRRNKNLKARQNKKLKARKNKIAKRKNAKKLMKKEPQSDLEARHHWSRKGWRKMSKNRKGYAMGGWKGKWKSSKYGGNKSCGAQSSGMMSTPPPPASCPCAQGASGAMSSSSSPMTPPLTPPMSNNPNNAAAGVALGSAGTGLVPDMSANSASQAAAASASSAPAASVAPASGSSAAVGASSSTAATSSAGTAMGSTPGAAGSTTGATANSAAGPAAGSAGSASTGSTTGTGVTPPATDPNAAAAAAQASGAAASAASAPSAAASAAAASAPASAPSAAAAVGAASSPPAAAAGTTAGSSTPAMAPATPKRRLHHSSRALERRALNRFSARKIQDKRTTKVSANSPDTISKRLVKILAKRMAGKRNSALFN